MPQRPSFADAYTQAAQPAAPRKSFADTYGGGSASGIDLNHIAELEKEFGLAPPAPPTDLISRGRNAPRPRSSTDAPRGSGEEMLQRVLAASPQDWLSNAVRYGGGFLSGIPSAVPGVGSLVGGAIGGASEGLAQLIGGEEFDLPSIGVGAGVGMIPMGGLVKTAGRAGKPLLEQAAMAVKGAAGNAARGAALGTGQEAAYRFGQGELPGRDYGVREMLLPAAMGAGGLALAGEVGSRALKHVGIEVPPERVSPDTLRGVTPEARKTNYQTDRGYKPRPSFAEAYAEAGPPAPEPLDVSNRGMSVNAPYTPPAEGGVARVGADPRRAGSPPRPEGAPLDLAGPEPLLPAGDFPAFEGPARPRPVGSDPRRAPNPLNEGGPVDLTGPEPLLPGGDFPAIEGPGRPRPVGSDPRAAGSPPYQRTPQQLLEDFLYGKGNRPPVAPEQGPLPAAPWSPEEPGPAFPGSSTVSRAQEALGQGQGPDARLADFFGLKRGATAAPAAGFPGSDEVRAARASMEGGGAPSNPLAEFFGIKGAEPPVPVQAMPEGVPPVAAAPEPPAPSVGRMTATQLLERLKGGDPSVKMPGLTGDKLPRDWTDELRGMLDEMNEFQFGKAEMDEGLWDAGALSGRMGARKAPSRSAEVITESSSGHGGFKANPDYPNLKQTVAGAPVFHDIMAGKGGQRSAASRGLSRILEGGRPTSLTDRAVEIAQRRLLGDPDLSPRALPPMNPDVDFNAPRTGAAGALEDLATPPAGAGATGLPDTGAAAAMGAGDDIHPAIRELYDSLVPKWEADVLAQQQRGDPFIIDPTETLEDFARRITTEPEPRKLFSAERKVRKLIDAEKAGDAGFADPSMLMHLGSTGVGAAAGAAMDSDDPLTGAVGGGAMGALASIAGQRLMRGPKFATALERPGARPPTRNFLGELGDADPLQTARRVAGRPNTLPPAEVDARYNLGDTKGELGAIDPALLAKLGAAGVGAVGGSVLEPDHPFLGAALGGGAGLLAASPGAQRKMQPYVYEAMLSALALPKSMAGIVGSIGGSAIEHPERASRILKDFFSPQTIEDVRSNFKNTHIENRWAPDDSNAWRGPFTRAIVATDEAAKQSLQRSGFTPGYSSVMTGTADPRSDIGKAVSQFGRVAPILAPFTRTAVNLAERGAERIPGVNRIPAVRAMSDPMDTLPLFEEPGMSPVNRRALAGLAAIAGGIGYGAATSEGGPLEGFAGTTAEKMMLPGAGLYALPSSLAVSGTRQFLDRDKGGPLQALNRMSKTFFDAVPLPEAVAPQEFLSRFAPAAGAYLSPVNPKDFDTSRGIFDPMLSRLPLINEMLLNNKRRRPARPADSKPPARPRR